MFPPPPPRVGQCVVLTPVVAVRPQEFAKLTLTPRKFLGIHFCWSLFLALTLLFLALTLTLRLCSSSERS